LGNLRKHLTTYFVDKVLEQPFSVAEGTSMAEYALTLTPSSPNAEPKRARLDNLAHVLDFVRVHVLEQLPKTQSTTFFRSLAKSVTNGMLNLVLIPQLPSSFGLLPPFLDLVQQAVDFEEQYIVGLLRTGTQDRPVKAWTESLSNHYERQRRNIILEKCRSLLKEPIDTSSTFFAVLEHPVDTYLPTAIQGDTPEVEESAWGLEDNTNTTVPASAVVVDEDSWSFDDDDPASPRNFDSKDPMQGMQALVAEENAKDEDSWGLDDDTAEDNWGFDDDAGVQDAPEDNMDNGDTETEDDSAKHEDDQVADDAWGWKDEKSDTAIVEDTPAEENAWDDPWGEPAETEHNIAPAKAPKVAKRLEKLASKGKKMANGNGNGNGAPVPSPLPPSSPPRIAAASSTDTVTAKTRPRAATVKPAAIVTKVHPPVEQYRVTERAKRLLRMVEDAVAEGKQFAASNLFSKLATGSVPGSTLFQTASSVIDLYQAMYPIQHESPLETVEGALQFANDCLYLSGALGDLEEEVGNQAIVKERLAECKDHLDVLSRSWFQDATVSCPLVSSRLVLNRNKGTRVPAPRHRSLRRD
jgi:protein transport protein DSL1/ZW10